MIWGTLSPKPPTRGVTPLDPRALKSKTPTQNKVLAGVLLFKILCGVQGHHAPAEVRGKAPSKTVQSMFIIAKRLANRFFTNFSNNLKIFIQD